MKRRITAVAAALLIVFSIFSLTANAATVKYTVVKGDSLWKISVRYKVGLDEVIAANPQIPNPNLIYPNQVITVPIPDSTITSIEKQVIDLVNNIRVQYGLPKLTENWELSRCARYKSKDMLNKGYFSHTSPTYGSPFDMMTAFGIKYRTAGENIAKGYATAQAVVNGWMNSPGHRANILNASFTQIGVGYVSSGNIWTQMFIG